MRNTRYSSVIWFSV